MSPYLENKKIENNGEVINKSQVQKLLGVHIDYEFKFDIHIEILCEKVGKKLIALLQVIKFMSTNQAQLLMRSFTMSQFRMRCHSRQLCHNLDVIVEILIVK